MATIIIELANVSRMIVFLLPSRYHKVNRVRTDLALMVAFFVIGR
jgi:hypothetical protein